MDDIATHWKRLVRPYVRSPSSQSVIESAKTLARLVASNESILELHRTKVISLAQWFVSEADGKYTTRYRSKVVYELATNEPMSTVKINHEHVYARQDLAVQLLRGPERVDELFYQILGCIVTSEEHDRLPKTDTG